ncbi:MAG: electron transfer flavoprotein subunit alpha/FixB family protein, partial [Chlorobia bacterium]|nr:electron transfer flavoprotein subunit alpha/FixB family protein [Fimbriimonadaceae bacterium]
MARLLIVAFEDQEAEQLAGFARKLGLPFDILSLTGQAATDLGAEKVLNAGLSEIPTADGLAKSLQSLTSAYSHIASVSNMQSKDVLARLAGLLDAAMVTDALDLGGPTTFKRPMVAGSIIATVETLATPVIITVRPAGFPKVDREGNSTVESIALEVASKAFRTGATSRGSSRPDLSQAKVVVSGGRPLKDAATFEQVIGGFADALGGAVGATRAAVDSGIAPNELQVGQTGKIVAPDLYIAAGISGSTQHMAGIKDSKVI